VVRSRLKSKGRSEHKRFVGLPYECVIHENYIALSPYAVKLLIDLYMQYNSRNNGDFSAPWSMMKARGWRSPGTLSRAIKELLFYGWIIRSRVGGLNKCSLYAVTFQAIDECNDKKGNSKLDIAPTTTSPGNWKEIKNASPNAYQCSPNTYQSCK